VNDPAPLMHVDWQRYFQNLAKLIQQPLTPGMLPDLPFGKIAMTLSPRLLGRTTAGAGSAEQISVTAPLTLAAGALGITGSALSRVDDTNVTLTLGGSPLTALLAATSLTLGWTGTLGVARGGTNIASYATGDLLYASASAVLSKRAIGIAGDVLTVSGGLPAWSPLTGLGTGDLTRVNDTNVTLTLGGTPVDSLFKDVSLTLGWTGTLGVTRGGTGLGSVATGDLLYGSASNVLSARSIGSTGNVLTVAGGLPTWAAPAAAATSVIVDDTTTNAIMFPVWVTAATGSLPLKVTSTKLSFNPSTGFLGIGTASPNFSVDSRQATAYAVNGGAFFRVRADDGTNPVSTDNRLGGFLMGGRAATTVLNGAAVVAHAAATWTDTSIPTYLLFETTPSGTTTRNERVRITETGNVGIGVTGPTAYLHIKAGAAAASSAPLKFTSGTNQTTAEAGAMEYNGTNLFFTRAGTVRENVLVAIDNVTAPTTTPGVVIVNYYGANSTNYLGDPNRWLSVNVLGATYKIPLYN